MKTYIVAIFVCFGVCLLKYDTAAQTVNAGSSCSAAAPVCFSTSYSYPATVSGAVAETGPNYGCISNLTNPAWFYIQIQDSGTITFDINISPSAIRHVLWGPFSTPQNCGTNLSSGKIISCANNAGSARTATIPNAKTGQYYVFVIFNPNGNVANLTFNQTSTTGSTNCDILCNMTSITATAGVCGDAGNTGSYTVSGTVTTSLPPGGGTLTVSSSCGTSVVYNYPFSTSISYSLPYIGGKGDTCTITAVYSNNIYCSKSTSIVAPICCTVNAPASTSVCAGQPLSLSATGTSGGSYIWSGPNGFSSNQQNPVLNGTSAANGGSYSVYLTYGGCTTNPKSFNVTIKPKPASKNISHQ